LNTIIKTVTEESIRQAAEILKQGGIVAFPTDTVYGLGAICTDEEAVKKIFAAKGRDEGKPLSILVSSIEQAEKIALENLHTAADGRISYVLLTKKSREGLADEYFETAIEIARAVSGASLCFSMREIGDGMFRTSLRARESDVASVAASFGGGGHLRAAGCTVEAASIEDAADKILARLVELI
jgi:nanoRNase/pAp phosphatase (c-di-AMP/oligoRNAs hydrolase)